MDECVIDIFRPLPVVINDVFKSFFDSVYDWICVALHLVCMYFLDYYVLLAYYYYYYYYFLLCNCFIVISAFGVNNRVQNTVTN